MKDGWKPLPISLKVLAILLIFWSVMTLFQLRFAYEVGFPILGVIFNEAGGIITVLLLNFLAPIIFLHGMCKRKLWAVKFAVIFMGFFIINSTVAYFKVLETFGAGGILGPLIAMAVFLVIVLSNKKYFK